MPVREIMPQEALDQIRGGGVVLLDVRTLPEWESMRVPGSLHIPMDELSHRLSELDEGTATLVLCAHGIRSAAVAQWLASHGYKDVANVRHGISRWPGPLEP